MSKSWILATVAMVCASVPATGQSGETAWAERYYNPAPSHDDLILPMPCGGQMAFRRVDIASAGYLADQRVQIGVRQDNVAFKEDARFDYISGSFTTAGQSSSRHYYIGKYEVTALQLAALNGACESPSTRLMLPATELSWFDAVEASRNYSEWLMTHASDSLPTEEDAVPFIRLPSETEWEFAARGGERVDEADFGGRQFPMPDGQLAEYVWYQGSQSAAGRLRPVGLLEPNPLGIHDILGNASEITLELFRLNRRGRLHGQAGGFVTRGGDISTTQSQMRTSLRNENQFYDAASGRARVVPNAGIRFVLTLPVIVSQSRLSQIREEWTSLPAPDLGAARADEQRDALAQLAAVSEETEDNAIRQRLDEAIDELERARTSQNDIRDRAVLALLQSGSIIGNKIKTDPLLIARAELVVPELSAAREEVLGVLARAEAADAMTQVQTAQAMIERFDSQIDRQLARIEQLQSDNRSTIASYSDLVYSVATDYSATLVARQLELLIADYDSKGFQYLIPYAQVFVSHVEFFRSSGRLERDDWADQIIELGGTHDE